MRTHSARFLRVAGALLALATAAAMAFRATQLPHEPYLGMSERGAQIALVIPDGPAARAGLEGGDRILRLDEVPYDSLANPPASLRLCVPGKPLALIVERQGRTLPALVVPGRLPECEILWLLGHAVVALATLLVGAVVFFRRLGRLTGTFFGMCLALATLIFRPCLIPTWWGLRWDGLAGEILSMVLPGLLLHFFLLFPYEREALRRRPWIQGLIYLPGLLLFLGAHLRPSDLAQAGLSADRVNIWLESGAGIQGLVALVGAVWLFAQSYRRSPLPTIRRKLKVTLLGTLLGLLPLLLVLGAHTVRPDLQIPGDRAATLMVFLLPASFGYAILRHGIFEIEFIVKRSLFYSAATALLVLVYFLVYFALRALLHNVTGISEGLGSLLAVAFVFLVMSPIRVSVQERLDRWVYPDRYEIRRALRDAGALLRAARGLDAVEQAILQTVHSLLGVQQAGLMRPANGGETFQLSATLDSGAVGALTVAAHPVGRLLSDPLFRWGRPILRNDLEAELPYGFLPRQDLETLELLTARALVPFSSGDRRLGILVLGARSFGEFYTPPDLELLEGLQAQAALALENARQAHELAGREDFQREMEVARTLQQQLLPRQIPKLPFLEIAATNLPCREVGGDYYDFLQGEDWDLTLAIGDVSGKGVPAALLMANVQATFRAEASQGRPPHELCERMNRRLCSIDLPDRFVSFFCGRLDLAERRLSYANAGHLQPMLIHADGRVERLDRGGLLLGITEEASYEGDQVRLSPGDLLLLFTDGVVERGGAASTFLEPDLERVARTHRHLSAPDLMGRILEELERANGSVADDDTTLVILKAL